MKRNKYLFVLCMLFAITLAGGIFTKTYVELEEQEGHSGKLWVVTSFYPVYIAAANVVGDSEGVLLENLSEPQTGCLHDYQLTPQDMILLSKADLFLVNGGGIEGFLEEVGESCPGLTIRKVTEGIVLLEETGLHEYDEKEVHEEGEVHGEEGSHEGENAHGWMDTRRYMQMVKNIADFLSEADEENAEVYQENARIYCEQVEKLTERIAEINAAFAAKSDAQTGKVKTVIFHEAYAYVAEEFGLDVAYCLNLDEERQVSAGEIADVLEEIHSNQVSFILAEEQYGRDMGETVEAETDCQVYYLDTLVRGTYEKDSYLKAMEQNIAIMEQIEREL